MPATATKTTKRDRDSLFEFWNSGFREFSFVTENLFFESHRNSHRGRDQNLDKTAKVWVLNYENRERGNVHGFDLRSWFLWFQYLTLPWLFNYQAPARISSLDSRPEPPKPTQPRAHTPPPYGPETSPFWLCLKVCAKFRTNLSQTFNELSASFSNFHRFEKHHKKRATSYNSQKNRTQNKTWLITQENSIKP